MVPQNQKVTLRTQDSYDPISPDTQLGDECTYVWTCENLTNDTSSNPTCSNNVYLSNIPELSVVSGTACSFFSILDTGDNELVIPKDTMPEGYYYFTVSITCGNTTGTNCTTLQV